MATDPTTLSNTELASAARATSRGTQIVKKGEEMDKNSFLKILSAELSNQDPTKAQDGTAFVAQMAQFSSLEQMSNLNSTMAFQTSSSLVGKMVAFSSYDGMGVQYGGIVQAAYKESGTTYLAVKLANGTTKDFPADTLSDVIDVPDNSLDNISSNAGFSAAITLMGKQVTTSALADGENAKKVYSGVVKSVSRDSTGIKLTITYEESGVVSTKDISYDDIAKVG